MNESIQFVLPQDDTLQYKVYVSKAVPRGEATLTATIVLIVSTHNNAPEIVNQRVFEALAAFVAVPWDGMSSERETISPGFEKVQVHVLAKIAADENRNLEERARHASREGLEITSIKVKPTLPQEQVHQIVKALWFETVDKVNRHLAEFNRASGRIWRIGDLVFGVPETGKTRTVMSKGSYREEPDELIGEMFESGIAGLDKIGLATQVTLKSARPTSTDRPE